MTKAKVLVTGASGFIALHCIDQLLKAGYTVRGTLRTMSRESDVRDALSESSDALEFAYTDLMEDEGWNEAAQGCDYVLHIASPVPLTEPKHEDELILPARDGKLRVLRACREAGVKRVVMTSSSVVMMAGHEAHKGHTFSETDWADADDKHVAAYPKSKIIAERVAWDFVNAEEGPELSVINPGAVLGPLLSPTFSITGNIIRQLMIKDMPAVPRFGINMIDVRDIAEAHIIAMTHPEAAGQRYLCCSDHIWLSEIANILSEKYSAEGWQVPTKTLPDLVVRVGSLFNPVLKRIKPLLGSVYQVDNTKIRGLLGRELRSHEDTLIAMADSMIALGVVKKE